MKYGLDCVQEKAVPMDGNTRVEFSPAAYLASVGIGRKQVLFKSKKVLFVQGSPADSVFYIQSGRAKLTVVSKRGKEATITLLTTGDFVGEESLSGPDIRRKATATAISSCVTLKIDRHEMLRVLHTYHDFSDFFLKFVLTRAVKTQADLIDQLFNSSERRLARALLLMAEFGQPGEPVTLIPKISQETLAEMIGTTRSRVSFFMNRFRRLGYIEYHGRIRVHKSLLNMVLKDQMPNQNASRPDMRTKQSGSKTAVTGTEIV
jgi:CRP/FNR family cyclic AMP-dependent transcriptional regulator